MGAGKTFPPSYPIQYLSPLTVKHSRESVCLSLFKCPTLTRFILFILVQPFVSLLPSSRCLFSGLLLVSLVGAFFERVRRIRCVVFLKLSKAISSHQTEFFKHHRQHRTEAHRLAKAVREHIWWLFVPMIWMLIPGFCKKPRMSVLSFSWATRMSVFRKFLACCKRDRRGTRMRQYSPPLRHRQRDPTMHRHIQSWKMFDNQVFW